MKKLTLLLTSLLLAGGASAAVLNFENVEPQVIESHDFKVAHPCWVGRVHVGDHRDGQGAQCAKPEWIDMCARQNRPLDINKGGQCGSCPAGKVAWLSQHRPIAYNPHRLIDGAKNYTESVKRMIRKDRGAIYNAHRCVDRLAPSQLDCHTNEYDVHYCVWNKTCTAGYSYQKVHNKCISFEELNTFCKRHKGTSYDPNTDKCRPNRSDDLYNLYRSQ